jgi:DNA-binding NarL/FixJ family response regulator
VTGVPLSWPLVGRADELEQMALARAAGRPAVTIHGVAGVGKSRLAREALEAARSEGCVTVWVQATRSASAVPLGAFASELGAEVHSDDRFALLRHGVETLRTRAGEHPLVLGVDDAHLLDAVSAALVMQLAATGAAFVIATLRSGEPVPDAIVSLWKDAGAQRVELGELSEFDTDALVEALVGGPVERDARRGLYETSGGNALYVRELVHGASLQQVSGLWRLREPSSVSLSLRELVGTRLAALAQAERQVLELLALGEPLALSELRALGDEPPLAAAEAHGLVRIDAASVDGAVRLTDPLFGDVIRAELPLLRARSLRARLAETLRARDALTPDDTLRLASWLLDAGEPVPIALLLGAAQAANRSGDPDLGATLASQALASGGGTEAALLLARAHAARHRFEDAQSVLAAAEEDIQTRELALEYLEQASEVLHWGLKRLGDLRALLDRAEGWWPDRDWQLDLEPLRLRIDSFERLGAAGTQLQPARPGTDPLRVANLFYAGRTAEAMHLALRIRPTPPVHSLNDAIALSLWVRITLESGERWHELETWMTAALELGTRNSPATAGQAAYALAALRYLAGKYVEARLMLAEAEVQLERHDPVGLLTVTNALQVSVAAFTGGPDAALPALQRLHTRLDDAPPLAHQLPYVVRAEAWATYFDGDPPRAQHLLLNAALELSASPVHAARLTYEALRAGAPARAHAQALESLATRCDARLVTAYAAHATARATDDGLALLNVADEFSTIGATRYAAEAAAHAADAFGRAARRDSARRAAARSRQLHALGQGGPAPPIADLEGTLPDLTARESQLVGLASRGLSNAEIADQLVVSIRTVESHLYKAMQKLGVSNRRDLDPSD